MDFAGMKVVELRGFLSTKGLPTNGNKRMLIDRATTYWNHLQRHKSSHRTASDRESTESDTPTNGNETSESPTTPAVVDSDGGLTSVKCEPPLVKVESPIPAVTQESVIPGLGPDTVEGTVSEEQSVGEDSQSEEPPMEAQTVEGSDQTDQESSDAVKTETSGNKRRNRSLEYPKKRKRMLSSVPKNALQILNEKRPGLKFEVVGQSGTPTNPLFKVSVTVDGVEYIGEASSKKAAKHAAAEQVVDENAAGSTPMKEQSVTDDSMSAESPIGAQGVEGIDGLNTESQSVANSVGSGKKRRNHSLDYPMKRKRIFAPVPKNALQMLNERMPGLKYEVVSQTGTPNSPLFKMSVTVGGVEYFGEASSKKAAKHDAAVKVLDSMGISPIGAAPPAHMLGGMALPPIDFTSDDPMWYGCEFAGMIDAPLAEPEIPPQIAVVSQRPFTPRKERNLDSIRAKLLGSDPEVKHPVMILNQLCSDLTYSATERTSSKTFIIKATVDGVEYDGEGSSKKIAKQALAIKVLKEKFGIISRHHPEQLPVASSDTGDDSMLIADAGRLPDLVSDLVKNKFKDLTDGTPHASRKVLAGIVRTREFGPEVNDGEVICIATGTKCISGDHISIMGTAVNDCHAEVVCRRALRKYLYDQLLLYASDREASVFEACDGSDGTKGYRLKSDVFFHLYINTSPCGDSRIFSPHETQKQGDDHPNRKARGLLRTKIEVGEGTIPVLQHDSQIIDGIQPWDSIIGGERLLTMSCSDKLARWNLLGIQGSLLSMYIEPVYFSSIMLGSLYHSAHFSRGVYTRVRDAMNAFQNQLKDDDKPKREPAVAIEKPFKMHRPLLASVSMPEKRKAGSRAPNFCLHWTVGDETPTVLNTATGMGEQSSISYLCKMETFRLFHKLMAEKGLLPKMDVPKNIKDISYSEMKNHASDYQVLKKNLHTGFKALGVGTWVKKPPEVDSFSLRSLATEGDNIQTE